MAVLNFKDRPLQEQSQRLSADIELAYKKISWYNKHPLHHGAVKRAAVKNDRLQHVRELQTKKNKIDKKIKDER
jgi:hypothetical protein